MSTARGGRRALTAIRRSHTPGERGDGRADLVMLAWLAQSPHVPVTGPARGRALEVMAEIADND